MRRARTIKEYVMRNTNAGAGDECWEWELKERVIGYGRGKWKGKRYMAHRMSWMAFKGEIPKGMEVCHKCDNPSCVNPDHLFLGTHDDNMKDAVKKKRIYRANGEKSYAAVLTDKQVLKILSEDTPGAEIAREYGVGRDVINKIRKRKTWKHLDVKQPAYRDGREKPCC